MEISTLIHVVQKNKIGFNLTRLHISRLVGIKSWCSFLQGEERDTLQLHAWNVRPSKGISVDLTMFCGVKNTTPPSSKIMTTMRLCKKIKRKDRRRVNDCQSREKEKGHCPFFLLQGWGGFSVWRSRKIFLTNKIEQDKCVPSAQSLLFSFLEHTYSSVHEQKPTTG